MSWILVWSAPKLWWKKDPPVCKESSLNTLSWLLTGVSSNQFQLTPCLYVLNFGMVGGQILVKNKDPPVCPEFWHGRRPNSGEKERPSCMSWILVWLTTKFWWKRKTLLYVLNFGMVSAQILVKKKDPPVRPEFWYGRRPNSGEKNPPSVVTVGLGWPQARTKLLFFYSTHFRG